MKKVLLILLLIIIIPFAGLIIFLKTADFNNYKTQIEELALKYAGLKVKINGDLKIGVSLKPSVDLNDVSISDASTDKKIAQIGSTQVEFSILPLLKKEIVVDTVQTSQTEVFYGENESVMISELQVSQKSFSSPIDLSFDTTVSGIKISGEGSLSSLKDIQTSDYNSVSADMKVNALGYDVSFKGDVTGLKSKIVADGDYEAKYKTNTVKGKVNANLTGKLPYVKISAASDKITLSDFTEEKQASVLNFVRTANASELIKNTEIPYDMLKLADADVSAEIKNLEINTDMSLSDISVSAALKSGILKADIKNITAGKGAVKGTVSLNSETKTAAVNLSGSDIILQNLYTALAKESNDEYIKSGGKSFFTVKLNTSGKDTNQYLENLNGQVAALVDESVIKIKSLEKLQGSLFAQILSNLNINVVNKDLNMSCAVVRGDITGGVIKFPKGIAVDANDFYLVADGKANLNNDKLNIDLQPFSGKISDANVSSVLGSLLSIKGTFSKPELGLNKTGTVKTVVGALATGGAFTAGDLLLSPDSSPCHTALKGTVYADYFKGDESAEAEVSNTYNEAKDAVKDLGNQAKDLLKGFLKGKSE